MRQKVTTGIAGLDDVLYGGIPQSSVVLLEGKPGTGKTTFGIQFLYNGIEQHGEAGIYLTFEELPEQIYEDSEQYGWDLRELERREKLRILCISPEILFEQMLVPNGLFERVIKEIDCKRVVIDSISLFRDGMADGEDRRKFYQLRNILRKMQVTSILIEEQQFSKESISYEQYVVDGVIHLSLQEWQQHYRQRRLEVKKMRGSRIREGEHVYRMTNQGIHLVPALTMIEEVSEAKASLISTGIGELDELLGGGFSTGKVYILDTNSKANFRYILLSIMSQWLKRGAHMLMLPSSLHSPASLVHNFKQYETDLLQVARDERILFIEHYTRSYPSEFDHTVIPVKGLDAAAYRNKLQQQVTEKWLPRKPADSPAFVYYDMNTILSERGREFVVDYFTEESANVRKYGATMLVLCNFAEVGEEVSSFLERCADGVIRTWVDGRYQYLQVTKSTHGQMSEPMIIENIPHLPYVRLV